MLDSYGAARADKIFATKPQKVLMDVGSWKWEEATVVPQGQSRYSFRYFLEEGSYKKSLKESFREQRGKTAFSVITRE